MQTAYAYWPVLMFASFIAAILFAASTDRAAQIARIASAVSRLRIERFKFRLSASRVVMTLLLTCLLSYMWTYQRIQDAIAEQLIVHKLDKVEVRSLIIPYSAFVQSAYIADAGFTMSKKRTRAAVAVRGFGWGALEVQLNDAALAKINKVAGGTMVFAYLTDDDVNKLRPAIKTYMDKLTRAEQITKYEIETFDNRGPYLFVALTESRSDEARSDESVAQSAKAIADGLYANLINTEKLKVNRVVVKIVARDAYLADKTIQVIARGTAGSY